MSFKLKTISPQLVEARERLYLTGDGKTVVKEGDSRAAFLFACVGQAIPSATAKAFGLVSEPKQEVLGVEPETRSTRPKAPSHTR